MMGAAPAAASFVNFETGQVRPLALSPDGTRLFAVNTPAGRLDIFSVLDGNLTPLDSVAVGLERTGRIVTAAALLFSIAIGAFATSQLVFIKEVGLGTAIAVLIDATIIRALLVPSLMQLLGRWNWWAPAPLRRLHDRIRPHLA